MNEPFIYSLPNGIRIVHKELSNTKVMHCGIVLDIGSRDEKESQKGLAHFWEHMAFKGTSKRKAFHIINRLDSLGGELNAFTTKEKISFYASIMDIHFEKAIELLKDITFDSTFPLKQIEREKGVILEEMSMYKDSPEDALHDEFDEVIFGDHPLGYNILGTSDSVSGFSQQDFKTFLQENFDTSRIVFTSIGNLSFKKVKYLAEKYFGDIPTISAKSHRKSFEIYIPNERTIEKPINQVHCSMGRTAYPFAHEKKHILFMLNNILGGPAMNSRLNMSLRERKGFVYSIESSYTPYEDTGLFGIYFATEPSSVDKGIKNIWKELNLLKEKKLGINQIKSAKEQLIGQIAISEERNISFMLMMGKSLLEIDRVETLPEIFEKIKSISETDLMEVASELFNKNEFSTLLYTTQK